MYFGCIISVFCYCCDVKRYTVYVFLFEIFISFLLFTHCVYINTRCVCTTHTCTINRVYTHTQRTQCFLILIYIGVH